MGITTTQMTKLTKGILEDIKSTEGDYEFIPEDFSTDSECEIYRDQLDITFKIGVITYVVVFKVEHTWKNVHNGNDGWNQPSGYEIENEQTNIEIIEMFTEDDEKDVDFKDFEGDLASHIVEKYIYPYV